jgi:hypothetical protein
MYAKFNYRNMAQALVEHIERKYPSYTCEVVRPPRCRKYRVAIHCRATGAFLTYARKQEY